VSCSIRRDAILAEIDAASTERLLNGRSRLALKLLGALNQGLVAALRSADRQLMRLNAERETPWSVDGETPLAAEAVVTTAPASTAPAST
jgi:hypothetical protein